MSKPSLTRLPIERFVEIDLSKISGVFDSLPDTFAILVDGQLMVFGGIEYESIKTYIMNYLGTGDNP